LNFGGGLGRGMSGSDRDLDEVEAKFEYGTWGFGMGRGQGSWIFYNTIQQYFIRRYSNGQYEITKVFSKFVSITLEYIKRHAPLKRVSRKKKLMRKPWITKGILVSIRRKQKLYVSHYLKWSETEKQIHKSYANN